MGKEENEIEKYLMKQVVKRGGFSRKYTSPGYRGVPDRICFLPRGIILFVEVKTPQGKLSKLQEREIMRMRELGTLAVCVRGTADIDKLMGDIDGHYRKLEQVSRHRRDKEQEAPLIVTPSDARRGR